MLASRPRRDAAERQPCLLNQLRAFVGEIFPEDARWERTANSEVLIDRLEGSRRSIKGSLFEEIVRWNLDKIFKSQILEGVKDSHSGNMTQSNLEASKSLNHKSLI